MTLSTEEIQELAQILDARAGHGRSERPKLRLITPPTPQLLDSIARESHLRRIGHLRRRYRLDWLVDQASFSVASVTLLEDCDLIRLLLDMERARECIADGISFEDAGLVRSVIDEDAPSVPICRALARQLDLAAIGVRCTTPYNMPEEIEDPF